jgi:hypothetical protein
MVCVTGWWAVRLVVNARNNGDMAGWPCLRTRDLLDIRFFLLTVARPTAARDNGTRRAQNCPTHRSPDSSRNSIDIPARG